jgi:chloramphenicol-sensitive protein RarD
LSSSSTRGLTAGIVAFTLWGLLPGYWKALHWLSAGQIICFRALLTVPVLVVILLWRRELVSVLGAMRRPRVLGLHLLTAALLAGNWITFVWATQHARIVEVSLGYFLTPLANVAMGAIFLGERLRRVQWIAIAFAAAGVALQVAAVGSVPWVALSLCATFALYGLLRKQASLDSLAGLTVESLVAIPAAALWLWFSPPERFAAGPFEWSLMLSMGVITAVPLLGFATAARLLPLSVLGILQFITPSLQFLVGAVVFGEPVSPLRLVSFVLIWIGLAVFTAEAWRRARARQITVDTAA